MAGRTTQLIAFERHRVNSQLQVLSEWIALGRLGKGAEYVDQVVQEESRRWAATLHAVPPWSQLRLIGLWEAAERAGVTVVADVETGSDPALRPPFTALERAGRSSAHLSHLGIWRFI